MFHNYFLKMKKMVQVILILITGQKIQINGVFQEELFIPSR